MYGYIYRIIINHPGCTLNGCYYIGQHKPNGKSYYGSGVILEDYKEKYGKDKLKIEILCECQSAEELNQKEAELLSNLWNVDAYDKGGKCLNLKAGGNHPGISESTRLKHKLNSKGCHHSIETRKKLSEIKKGIPCLKNRGKHRSEETKRKISLSQKGRKQPEWLKELNRKAHLGLTHTEEAKKKIGETSKQRWKDPEYKAKVKKAFSKAALGKHWWTNGKIRKFCKDCPGADFKRDTMAVRKKDDLK